MRITALLVLSAVLLAGCDKDENAKPRPPIGQEDLVGQDLHFKVKPDEWEAHGTPGDDTHGYAVMKDVHILTDATAQHGTVRVYLRKGHNNWAQLPLKAHQGAPSGFNWRFTYRANLVQVFIDRNGEAFSPPDQLMTFKVVVF